MAGTSFSNIYGVTLWGVPVSSCHIGISEEYIVGVSCVNSRIFNQVECSYCPHREILIHNFNNLGNVVLKTYTPQYLCGVYRISVSISSIFVTSCQPGEKSQRKRKHIYFLLLHHHTVPYYVVSAAFKPRLRRNKLWAPDFLGSPSSVDL